MAYTPTGESFPVADAAARWAFTAEDMTGIETAYDILTRKGNETSHGDDWDPILDRAHHGLGLIIALVTAGDLRNGRPVAGESASST